jgi:hypothetical protein
METPWSGLVNGDDGYGSVGLWEGGAEQDEEQEKKTKKTKERKKSEDRRRWGGWLGAMTLSVK